jgi:hypothetical protein
MKISMTTGTLQQIRRKGLKALVDELGPVGAIRFLQQYETGVGDYSVERRRRIGNQTVVHLARQLAKERKKSSR